MYCIVLYCIVFNTKPYTLFISGLVGQLLRLVGGKSYSIRRIIEEYILRHVTSRHVTSSDQMCRDGTSPLFVCVFAQKLPDFRFIFMFHFISFHFISFHIPYCELAPYRTVSQIDGGYRRMRWLVMMQAKSKEGGRKAKQSTAKHSTAQHSTAQPSTSHHSTHSFINSFVASINSFIIH